MTTILEQELCVTKCEVCISTMQLFAIAREELEELTAERDNLEAENAQLNSILKAVRLDLMVVQDAYGVATREVDRLRRIATTLSTACRAVVTAYQDAASI